MFNKKFLVTDWIDPEFIIEEYSKLYPGNIDESKIKPEHCVYTFYDVMISNFKAKKTRIIHFANFDDEYEYLEKVTHNDFDKRNYNRLIRPKMRYEILTRDNRTFQVCGKGIKQGTTLHIDHKIPVAKGGKTEKENLQTLCDKCNYEGAN